MLLRSVVSCATVRPRYSVSTAAPELRNLSAISAMAAAFSGLATGPPSEMKRRRRLPLTKGAPAQARGSRHTKKVCRSPTILRWLPACCGTFDHPARGRMTTGGLWSVSSVRAARPQSKSALAREASHRTGGTLGQKSEAAPMIRCGLEVQARGQTIRGLGRLFLDQKVLRAALIQRNAGAHGRGHHCSLDETALGSGRLQTQDLVQRRTIVLHQLGLVEGGLADDEVEVGMLVGAELDLAALDLGDSLGHVHRHGTGLGVGHEAARTQHLTQTADLAHEVRGRHDRVEVEPAACHLFEQLVRADVIGPSGLCLLCPLAGGEDQDPCGLARAVREVDGAADHLVGLAWVNAQSQGNFNGRVVLGAGGAFGQTDGLKGCVELVGADLLGGGAVCLAALHLCSWCFAAVMQTSWTAEFVVERTSAGPATDRYAVRPHPQGEGPK